MTYLICWTGFDGISREDEMDFESIEKLREHMTFLEARGATCVEALGDDDAVVTVDA